MNKDLKYKINRSKDEESEWERWVNEYLVRKEMNDEGEGPSFIILVLQYVYY
jgi:hypothetical protein